MAATATETRRQSAVAAGQPETPPNPYEVAQRFREERETTADLQRRVRDYEQLTPKQQFDTAVEAGVIPEGSRFVAGLDIDTTDKRRVERLTQATGRPVGTWGYYSPTQLSQMERTEEAQEKELQRRKKAVENWEVIQTKAEARDTKAFEEALKDQPKGLQLAYKRGGVEAYNYYLKKNYIELPDNEWIDKPTVNRIKEQTQYGYNILKNDGIDAYEKEVAQALKELEDYKRGKGYNLRRAAAQGVSLER